MNDNDFEVMKKYRFGRVLDEEDRTVVQGLYGYMKIGERKITRLTETGEKDYYWERVRRNPLRRFWCNLIHSF